MKYLLIKKSSYTINQDQPKLPKSKTYLHEESCALVVF
jgi:hypothetical protein